MFFKRKKVALCLGGGAARGLANIGVLKVLEREKVPIDALIGSSMGGLIAAVYGSGKPIAFLEEQALKFSVKELLDMTFPRIAATKGEKLAKLIARYTDMKSFEHATIPTAITATDIKTGRELLFRAGNLQKIVQASCSWPGIFPPVEIDGNLLMDGGLRHSVPTKWAHTCGGEFVVAVKVGFEPMAIDASNIFQLIIQSLQIMGEELDRYQSMNADIVIEPKLKGMTQLDFDKAKAIIAAGEEATEKILPELKKKLFS